MKHFFKKSSNLNTNKPLNLGTCERVYFLVKLRSEVATELSRTNFNDC